MAHLRFVGSIPLERLRDGTKVTNGAPLHPSISGGLNLPGEHPQKNVARPHGWCFMLEPLQPCLAQRLKPERFQTLQFRLDVLRTFYRAAARPDARSTSRLVMG